jgi:hypothetical protein
MPNSDLLQPKKFAGIPLKPYWHWFSLDRLKLGVDNLRYDIHLGPGFIKATRWIALQLIGRVSGVADLPDYENGLTGIAARRSSKDSAATSFPTPSNALSRTMNFRSCSWPKPPSR